ncbi:MAG: SsrA-binding protein SmpB [Bacteroidales bacterium]|nr:SsrA-binding protein SmpB [Bacteroidales bacterium]
MAQQAIKVKNKKASFEYSLVEKFVAGMQLQGTEIKSIRQGKANLSDAYCVMREGELFVKQMHIAEYSHGTYNNHEPKRDRKLLLNKGELKKIETKTKEKGFTIVPTLLFINEKGLAKLEIAIAKGKKLHDKRESIKQKDMKRDMERSGF